MALGVGSAALEKTAKTEIKESDNLPKRLETQRESDCLPDRLGMRQESNLSEVADEKQIEIQNEDLEKLEAMIDTPEGLRKLMEDHPEKAESWQSALEAVETLNDPDTTDAEKRSATGRLNAMQGQLLEIAAKDLLAAHGLSVESKQRTLDGQDGGTRPDVIAKNETRDPVVVFGTIIEPGGTISVECKCGGKSYLDSQLRNHIPNQLSGQIGHKMLLTTGDIRQVDSDLVQNTCKGHNAKLVTMRISASDVRDAIKGVVVS